MMLQLDDDGVVSKVNEDDLIYVYKNEFKELIDEYEQLKKENAKLQFELKECSNRKLFSRRVLEKKNEVLKERNQELYDKLQETMSKHSLQMGETELIKHMIQEAYTNERTQIGKNVLKQLLNNI